MDLFGVLLALASADAADPRQAAVDRGLALLMLGRPHEALRELADVLPVPVPAGAPRDEARLTVEACQAATGDDAAYRRLLSLHGSDHWLPAYLTGAAADARGDHDLADQAWIKAAEVSQLSDHLYPRWASAIVGRRDRLDAHPMVHMLNSVAVQGRPDRRLHANVDHATTAVRRLAPRDPVGAWLLSQALVTWQEGTDELKQLGDQLRPPGVRRFTLLSRWTAGLIVVLAPLAIVPYGMVGIGLVAAARAVWKRRAPVPGLTLGESQAWRKMLGMRFNRHSGQADTRGDIGSLALLGLVAGLVVGLGVSVAILDLLARLSGATLPAVVQAAVCVGGVCGASAAGFLGARWARNWDLAQRRRRGERKAEQVALNDWQRCQCLLESRIGGPAAGIYARAHLSADAVVAGALPTLPAGSQLLSCSRTGILWLAVGAQGETPVALLRGAAPTAPSNVDTPGMYL